MLHSFSSKIFGIITLLFLVALLFFCSLAMGQTSISFSLALEVLTQYNPENPDHLIIATSRLARATIALTVGIALAIAGTLIQTLTRNPLASPDLLGINAGAIFFIVFAITWLDLQSMTQYMWFGFLGAAIAGLGVFFLSSLGRDGLTPIKVILAGTALSALFISFTQGMLVIDEQSIQTVLFWISGSIAGRDLNMLFAVLPFLVPAIVISLFIGKAMNIFGSGDDVAKSLGQNVGLLKILMGVLIIVLAGGSVAVVGSVGFIGLIVPHIAKGLVGTDYRWTLPFSALLGAALLIGADILARFLISPMEVPIGVMTAFIGGPFFIYLAKKGVSKQ
ncbi:iron-siderophore ABC transporter permease [Solibacillus sp. R5-41]|uniref:FecCD family ABC transporter permease n=1 Tax=Solibacillus sp. R5-41 TaxID=2048654 RepID=UPI000C128CCC|nr:iron ABC transporter permease [Solibacillus sp. R5-41]ATP39743.1 iron-siderophore ABC transporter permease [Solibacillus sp. R5-41]